MRLIVRACMLPGVQGGLRLPGCCTLAAPCYQTALGEQWDAVLYLGLQSTAPRSLKSLAISAHSVSRPLMIATVVSTSPCPRALSTPCRHPCNHAPRQLCWLTRQGHACEREAQTAGMLAESWARTQHGHAHSSHARHHHARHSQARDAHARHHGHHARRHRHPCGHAVRHAGRHAQAAAHVARYCLAGSAGTRALLARNCAAARVTPHASLRESTAHHAAAPALKFQGDTRCSRSGDSVHQGQAWTSLRHAHLPAQARATTRGRTA